MRKGSIVFLVLLVCSAVIVGTTLGLFCNMQYITTYLEGKTPTQIADNNEVPAPGSPIESRNYSAGPPAGKQRDFSTTPSRGYDVRTSQLLILTESEMREITQMLKELGYDKDSFRETVRLFQRDNHLQPTGILDVTTVNVMVKQAIQKKVQTFNR